MKSKKLYCILLTIALIITGFSFINYSSKPFDDSKQETFIEKKFLNCNYGYSSFSDYFLVNNDDGTTLNIYIKNNGKQPINYQIIHGKRAILSSGIIQPEKYILFTDKDKMFGKWVINANTSDGSKMNVNVKARQFLTI